MTPPPRRPVVQRWHQFRADKGKGEPVLGPAGTYRILDDGERVLAWVDEQSFPDDTQFPAITEAAQHTRYTTITLTGPSAETRRVATALHDYWDTVIPRKPRTPKPAKPPTLTKPRPLCGRPRKDGQPCQQYAGHGADDPVGPCRAHGGSTVRRQQEAEEMVTAALRWTELLKKASEAPLSPAEDLERLKSHRTVLAYRSRARRNPPSDRDF